MIVLVRNSIHELIIDARQLLKTASYQPGATLPPHLSPFRQYTEGDYIPEEAAQEMNQEEEQEELIEVHFFLNIQESDDEEEAQQELEAEAAGIKSSEFKKPAPSKKRKVNQAQEEHELAQMMMPKKDQYLYRQIQHGKKKKQEKVDHLKEKKKMLKLKKEKVQNKST